MMVLFVAEHADGRLKKSALELAGAAKSLAEALGSEVVGVVVGDDVTAVAQELTRYAPKVVALEHPELAQVRAQPYAAAIARLAQELDAKVVMVSASRSGLAYGPRIAVRLDAPLLEDVFEIGVEDGAVTAKRYSYLSRVTETVRAKSLPVVVSVKPNALPAAEPGAEGALERREAKVEEAETRVEVGERSAAKTGRVALEEARVVVTGGRGVGGPEGFEKLVEPLADALNAGIGATRAVVDAGWRPYGEQVGQTGKTVAPELYIALGVSGAVQHLSGMNRSKVIVAINKDGDAPIFKISDYGIVGDVNQVVPALTEALRQG